MNGQLEILRQNTLAAGWPFLRLCMQKGFLTQHLVCFRFAKYFCLFLYKQHLGVIYFDQQTGSLQILKQVFPSISAQTEKMKENR